MVNADKPERWASDTAVSVASFNDWFTNFAPDIYRTTQIAGIQLAQECLTYTFDLRHLSADVLRNHPKILPVLRMATLPPLARDRLSGLSATRGDIAEKMTLVVDNMDQDFRVPPSMPASAVTLYLDIICNTLLAFLDHGLFPWLAQNRDPRPEERDIAIHILADRYGAATADPIIRNEPEKLQIAQIEAFLIPRGYYRLTKHGRIGYRDLPAGTFAKLAGNTPIDIAIQPLKPRPDRLPILIEAKAAGDYTNTNKRRKEEAEKMGRLKNNYGPDVPYILYLWGYFNSTYLGHEATAGIDWVWHHRVDDLAQLGL